MRFAPSLFLSLVWCVADLPGQPPLPVPLDPCVVGEWTQKWAHKNTGNFAKLPQDQNPPNKMFNALHMALIPRTGTGQDYRGHVIVWDGHVTTNITTQRWSIVDPINETNANADLTMPAGKGDLFCTGHAWTKDGNLFVAGGQKQYSLIIGAKLAYIWDPTDVTWYSQPDLQKQRWYPTVTMDHNDKLIVTGGAIDEPSLGVFNWANNYEAFFVDTSPPNPRAGKWDNDGTNYFYLGPDPTKASILTQYPRFHLLSTGHIFMSGHGPDSAKIIHDKSRATNPLWIYTAGNDPNGIHRHDVNSVLFPIELDPNHGLSQDLVYRIGGKGGSTPVPLNSVETCQADKTAPDGDWKAGMSMAHNRLDSDSVLLPDGTILVIGGVSSQTPNVYVKTPELYKNGQWIEMADMDSPRDYHSTALLLPSGKVLVGGGQNRDWDYEVYSPPYLYCGARPVITAPLPGPGQVLAYGTTYTLHFNQMPTAPPTFPERIVLMRPGSVTHHSCMDQRYISLEIQIPTDPLPNWRVFTTPATKKLAPKGYYMLFLVNNHGVPSAAIWVQLK